MKQYLNLLQCPWCKCSFDWNEAGEDDRGYQYGILSCRCHDFPVVMGIPVLRKDALANLSRELIEEERLFESLVIQVNQPSAYLPFNHKLSRLLKNVSAPAVPRLIKTYLKTNASFENQFRTSFFQADTFLDVVKNMDVTSFGDYLLYRPFGYGFWNLHAFIPLIEQQSGPVLDYGGGIGHSTRFLRQMTGNNVFNLEPDFKVLYFYRRYLDPEGLAVHIGMDNDIPFAGGTFGSVVDLDGFHYVRNKSSIATEYERVAGQGGLICLLHLRNRHITGDGFPPLDPEKYQNCFNRNSTVVGERDLLDQFLNQDGPIELSHSGKITGDDLNMVIGADEGPVRISHQDRTFKNWSGTITVNPLYSSETEQSELLLKRKSMSNDFKQRYEFSFRHTREEYELTPGQDVWPLLKTGVLTTLPEGYAGNKDVSNFFGLEST